MWEIYNYKKNEQIKITTINIEGEIANLTRKKRKKIEKLHSSPSISCLTVGLSDCLTADGEELISVLVSADGSEGDAVLP